MKNPKRTPNPDIAISVNDITKSFTAGNAARTLKQMFTNKLKNEGRTKDYTAVRNISFEVKKGEFFGIVGRNGCGKSTLLKMIAGVYTPNSGDIVIDGKLIPFIELGVGFNPELSGRDNVYLNGALLGFSRKEMAKMYDAIVDFAELHEHMEVKLKNFSSGMQVRLAFSIAIRAQSDILLIDEVLAVGDAAFQSKCFEYFEELKQNKRTIVLVSHDRATVERYCTRAILIDEGRIVVSGRPESVFARYNEITETQIAGAKQSTSDAMKQEKKDPKRWGSGDARISKILINGEAKRSVVGAGKKIFFEVHCKANKDILSPIVGVTVSKRGQQPIFVANTRLSKIKLPDYKKGEGFVVAFEVSNIFANGSYEVAPAIADHNAVVMYDWKSGAAQLVSSGQQNPHALVNPPCETRVKSVSQK